MFAEIPQVAKPGRMKRFIQFPLTRIFIGIMFVLGSIIVANVGIEVIRRFITDAEKPSTPWLVLLFIVMTIMSILGYYAYVHWIEAATHRTGTNRSSEGTGYRLPHWRWTHDHHYFYSMDIRLL